MGNKQSTQHAHILDPPAPTQGPTTPVVPEAYSLWVATEGQMTQVQREIDTQAQAHGVASFAPHLGILGNILLPKATVIATARKLAAQVKPCEVKFIRTEHSHIYWRCLHVLCDGGEALQDMVTEARKAFNLPAKPAWPFLAHVSLMYANLTEEERVAAQAAATQRLFGDGNTRLTAASFPVTALEVWYTPSEDTTLKSWKLVETIELAQ